MNAEGTVAAIGAVVIAVVDALIIARVARSYRRSGRRTHLLIALGIMASYMAVVGACLLLASRGDPSLQLGAAWGVARFAGLVGAALAYGLVGVFAAEAFGSDRATGRLALGALVALVGLALAALQLEPRFIATPANIRWPLRVPFVGLSLAGSLGGGVRARSLVRAYRAARDRGRAVDPVALGRMHAMSGGFFCMAASQAALLGFGYRAGFDSVVGLFLVGLVMLGALGFSLACVATWATPAWVRARWEAQ